jgi:hypothetical protein
MRSGGELRIFLLLGLLVVAVWAGMGFWLLDEPDRGTFGDMFGAVNALFSGLAFAGVIVAILMQRSELELQRRELTLTREELRGQREALEKQNFESTFFQLLRLFNDLVAGITLPDANNPNLRVNGRACFENFHHSLMTAYRGVLREAGAIMVLDALNEAYRRFYVPRQGTLGHYFRTLYNIIKLVDRSQVAEKHLYTNLVRAQLSDFELILIFYNCLSARGRDNFKPLIEQYALLKALPREQLFDQNHLEYYAAGAYGRDGPAAANV